MAEADKYITQLTKQQKNFQAKETVPRFICLTQSIVIMIKIKSFCYSLEDIKSSEKDKEECFEGE